MTFNDIFKSSFLENVSEFSILDTLIGLAVALVIGLFIFIIYKKTLTGVLYLSLIHISSSSSRTSSSRSTPSATASRSCATAGSSASTRSRSCRACSSCPRCSATVSYTHLAVVEAHDGDVLRHALACAQELSLIHI